MGLANERVTMGMEDRKQILSTREAAQVLGLAKNTLEVWRCRPDRRPRSGMPPFVRIGGRIGYLRADLAAYIAARRTDGTGTAALAS
jgi:predicted DNA-binding transcriptional regulator AlpA